MVQNTEIKKLLILFLNVNIMKRFYFTLNIAMIVILFYII